MVLLPPPSLDSHLGSFAVTTNYSSPGPQTQALIY